MGNSISFICFSLDIRCTVHLQEKLKRTQKNMVKNQWILIKYLTKLIRIWLKFNTLGVANLQIIPSYRSLLSRITRSKHNNQKILITI